MSKPTSHHNALSGSQYACLIIGISILIRFLFLGSADLLVEEAYYWNYSTHLDFGYLDHPPMVALLIKFSTSVFGHHEFSVRITAFLCWLVTAFFSYQLTQLVSRNAGIYAVMLLSILPFFFLQSIVITPDQPLILCWAAALYCLYRALILKEPHYWYFTGIAIGLGMLSKYTICLLGLSTLVYLSIIPDARYWFRRKEPYLCALIALILFTPVIYWNATHEWVSFVFQGSRRFTVRSSFALHEFIGLLLLFLMPLGVWSLGELLKSKASTDLKGAAFFKVFVATPLLFFGLYSLSHPLRFNWIGPSLLAVLPYLAISIEKSLRSKQTFIYKSWFITAPCLFVIYGLMMSAMVKGVPSLLNKNAFQKFIAWNDLTHELNTAASAIEHRTGKTPIFVPLDTYNVSSELSYYQTRLLSQHLIEKAYPILGAHIFGRESLMYRYWGSRENLSGKIVILISIDPVDFERLPVLVEVISPIRTIQSHSQGINAPMKMYYYEVVKIQSSFAKSLLKKQDNLKKIP